MKIVQIEVGDILVIVPSKGRFQVAGRAEAGHLKAIALDGNSRDEVEIRLPNPEAPNNSIFNVFAEGRKAQSEGVGVTECPFQLPAHARLWRAGWIIERDMSETGASPETPYWQGRVGYFMRQVCPFNYPSNEADDWQKGFDASADFALMELKLGRVHV